MIFVLLKIKIFKDNENIILDIIKNFINDFNITIIIITHSHNVLSFCDNILYL
jgi:ABC-type lipoprotein export system ATPase subunit